VYVLILRDIVKIHEKELRMKTIKIDYNNKVYHIHKEKLSYVIERLNGSKVNDKEIKKYMEKFCLYDEYFLEHVNEIW